MADEDPSIPFFRPLKRRKVIRPRRASTSPNPEDQQQQHPHEVAAPSSLLPSEHHPAHQTIKNRNGDDDEEDGAEAQADSALASALRARSRLKNRKRGGGIPVSIRDEAPATTILSSSELVVARNAAGGAGSEDVSLQLQQQEEEGGGIFSSRFARPTGVVEDVMDKAMAAYIDSRIESMKLSEQRRLVQEEDMDMNVDMDKIDQQPQALPETNTIAAPAERITKPRDAIAAGKLQEIDLGPSSTHSNYIRTVAAAKRLDSPASQQQDYGLKKRKPRPGLGPDGKPWRNRRNRRTSDDLKRDALVESIMAGAPMDVFAPTVQSSAGDTGTDADADERMLQDFQREYFDAQTMRQARKPPPVTGKDKEAESKVKGPRLGGSRSARAAMHKALQDEAAKKKR